MPGCAQSKCSLFTDVFSVLLLLFSVPFEGFTREGASLGPAWAPAVPQKRLESEKPSAFTDCMRDGEG